MHPWWCCCGRLSKLLLCTVCCGSDLIGKVGLGLIQFLRAMWAVEWPACFCWCCPQRRTEPRRQHPRKLHHFYDFFTIDSPQQETRRVDICSASTANHAQHHISILGGNGDRFFFFFKSHSPRKDTVSYSTNSLFFFLFFLVVFIWYYPLNNTMARYKPPHNIASFTISFRSITIKRLSVLMVILSCRNSKFE